MQTTRTNESSFDSRNDQIHINKFVKTTCIWTCFYLLSDLIILATNKAFVVPIKCIHMMLVGNVN